MEDSSGCCLSSRCPLDSSCKSPWPLGGLRERHDRHCAQMFSQAHAENDEVFVVEAEEIEGDIAPGDLACAKEADDVGVDDRLQEHAQIIKTGLGELRRIVVEAVGCLTWPTRPGLEAGHGLGGRFLERHLDHATDMVAGIFGYRHPRN